LENSHLHFNTSIGVMKPENIRNKNQACPFCERDQLTNLIAVDEPIILLKNKYPVLENAYQTVLIETDDCQAKFSTYTLEHLHRLLRFGIKHWLDLEETGRYRSVIFFKNHGPLSGGSLKHPHMQIIGLDDIDYREKVTHDMFTGIVIDEAEGVRFTLSTKPRVGFYEFNIEMEDTSGYQERFSEYLQMAVHYIMNYFPFKATSYNVFFHHLGDKIYAKVISRFVTTPLYIGYGLPQVPNNLQWMASELRRIYFNNDVNPNVN
jgi:ATP adenylyltransferase/5',5'''-P-1,P-4-tetraphosphate phosphorylase II